MREFLHDMLCWHVQLCRKLELQHLHRWWILFERRILVLQLLVRYVPGLRRVGVHGLSGG